MALQITKTAGIYEINGDLNSQNVFSLNNHFESLLAHSKFITVSLNKLSDIDASAVLAIASLYKKALGTNKVFSILGRENHKVSEQFRTVKLIHILRGDTF